MERSINYLDLFSGIGGFHLGLKQAGFRFGWTGHSEIDRHAKAIYRKHFPESEDLGDVKEIRTEELPELDLITFGFPCQDLSNIGRRRGLHAERSGLFFEALRIIRAARPTSFIFENVQGLLHSNKGRDFEAVLRSIADLGLYECEGQLLNTAWLLPQNRERFYFVGHLRGKSRPRVFPFVALNGKGGVVPARHSPIEMVGSQKGIRITGQKIYSAHGASTCLVSSACDALFDHRFVIDRRSRRTKKIAHKGNVTLRSLKRRTRMLTPVERERIQGFPDGWTASGIYEDGEELAMSDYRRRIVLGNAVTVPVVQAIGMRLRE